MRDKHLRGIFTSVSRFLLIGGKSCPLLVTAIGINLILVACTTGPEKPAISDNTPFPSHSPERIEHGRVVSAIDGVTIVVDIEGQTHRVRYIGIEVPQEQIEGASQYNRFLVDGKSVILERDEVELDSSGDLLRYVYVNGEMANEALLVSGYGVVAPVPRGFRLHSSFLLAEENARFNSRGVWRNPQPGEVPSPVSATPSRVRDFEGGTLPFFPSSGSNQGCDYSESSAPVIKGVIDIESGERLIFIPGDPHYDTVTVDTAEGGQWFCSEGTAISFGWKKSSS